MSIELPEVSVVMSVHNGASTLGEAIQSVLSQEGVELELIAVNDGSRDASATILDEVARRDARVRVIHQTNQGLTRALIAGCKAAQGFCIARIDAGDVALPGRFLRQLTEFRKDARVVMVSCGTRFVAPRGELMYEVSQDQERAVEYLLSLDSTRVRGPSSHSSVMFLRSAYEAVGGYRGQFYFAQDLDLWVRLAEKGRYVVLPDILQQNCFSVNSITGRYRRNQLALTNIIVECASARRRGLSEERALRKAEGVIPKRRSSWRRLDRARVLYFIGSCLRRQGNEKSREYFYAAARAYPLHLKALYRMLID